LSTRYEGGGGRPTGVRVDGRPEVEGKIEPLKIDVADFIGGKRLGNLRSRAAGGGSLAGEIASTSKNKKEG